MAPSASADSSDQIFDFPIDVALVPQTQRLFVLEVGALNTLEYDGTQLQAHGLGGNDPRALATNGSTLYVLESAGTVRVVDTAALEVTDTFPVGIPAPVTRLAFAGGRVWFSNCTNAGALGSVALDGSDPLTYTAGLNRPKCPIFATSPGSPDVLYSAGQLTSGEWRIVRYDVGDGTPQVLAGRTFSEVPRDVDVAPAGGAIVTFDTGARELNGTDLDTVRTFARPVGMHPLAAVVAGNGSRVVVVGRTTDWSDHQVLVYDAADGSPEGSFGLFASCAGSRPLARLSVITPSGNRLFVVQDDALYIANDPLLPTGSLTAEPETYEAFPLDIVDVEGSLAPDGQSGEGKTIRLRAIYGGVWSQAAMTTSGPGGSFVLAPEIPVPTNLSGEICYEARWAGDATHRNLYASPFTIAFERGATELTFTGPDEIAPGLPLVLDGTLSFETPDALGSRTIRIYRSTATSGWQQIGVATTATDGSFEFPTDAPAAEGLYRYRATFAGDERNYSTGKSSGWVDVSFVPTSLILDAPNEVRYRTQIDVTATLPEHEDATDRVVRIYATEVDGAETLIKEGPVDRNGQLHATVPDPERNLSFRAEYGGDVRLLPSEAEGETDVGPRFVVKLKRYYGRRDGFHLYRKGVDPLMIATTTPDHAGKSMWFTMERRRDGGWNQVGDSVRVKIPSSGKTGVVVKSRALAVGGRYLLYAWFNGDRFNGYGESKRLLFRITR